MSQVLPVEHCPCCGTGLSRTMKPAVALRLTGPSWATESSCCIYVNPAQPSLAALICLRDEILVQSSLHLCQSKFLHFHDDWIDDRISLKPRPSVRTQVTQIVDHFLGEWQPAIIMIGTGNPDAPEPIPKLFLPDCWELSRSRSHVEKVRPKRKQLRR